MPAWRRQARRVASASAHTSRPRRGRVASVKEIAPDVFHIDCLRIPHAINAYVIGDVLVERAGAGTPTVS